MVPAARIWPAAHVGATPPAHLSGTHTTWTSPHRCMHPLPMPAPRLTPDHPPAAPRRHRPFQPRVLVPRSGGMCRLAAGRSGRGGEARHRHRHRPGHNASTASVCMSALHARTPGPGTCSYLHHRSLCTATTPPPSHQQPTPQRQLPCPCSFGLEGGRGGPPAWTVALLQG